MTDQDTEREREARLDALEAAAFEAWRNEPDPVDSHALIERIMAADSTLIPLVVVHDEPEPHPGLARSAATWGRSMRRWVAGVALAGAVVGSAGYLAWSGSGPRGVLITETSLGRSPGAAVDGTTVPVAALELGRADTPQLRPDGDPGVPLPPDFEHAIKSYIEGYGSNWGPTFAFHGVVVVARAGEIKFARGFGVARPQTGTPNGPGTRFRLGMLTEQFTAALVLQQRDAGLLTLDDPITMYVPELTRAEGVTIGHLLAHRSGLPNYTQTATFHEWKASPQRAETMLARFAAWEPGFEPGARFEPSNTGYYLLGVIAERVGGAPYPELLHASIFEPLGMRASGFGDAYETGEQAVGSVWNSDESLVPPEPIDMTAFGGAAGLVSSALDLVKWDRALERGEVLSAKSVDEMFTDHGGGYGYGFALSEGYGQPVASFPGVIDGFNGAMVRFMSDETLVVVLSNNEVIPGMRVAQDVAAIVFGDSPRRRVEHHEVEIAPGTFPRFVGTYALSAESWTSHVGAVDPEQLALLREVHVGAVDGRMFLDVPGHGVSWMHAMGHNRFFFKDHSGNTVSFEVRAGKEAKRMVVHYPEGDFVLERRQ